jgi:6-phosphofructokinase 1
VSTATDAIDKPHDRRAHHLVMVLELMGRDAGFIALHAGVAGGADVILIPEIPFSFERVCTTIKTRARRGARFSIIAVAEGAHPVGEEQTYKSAGDEVYVARLGGIGQVVAQVVESNCKMESRVKVLGQLQRRRTDGLDRWLATRFGAAAFRLAERGAHGRMVALSGTKITDVTLVEALSQPKRVDLQGDGVRTARNLGLCLGD